MNYNVIRLKVLSRVCTRRQFSANTASKKQKVKYQYLILKLEFIIIFLLEKKNKALTGC